MVAPKRGAGYSEKTGIFPSGLFSAVFAGAEMGPSEGLSRFSSTRIISDLGLAEGMMWALHGRRCGSRIAVSTVAGGRTRLRMQECMLLGALAAAPTWGVRPQVFSFLFASVFLSLLEDFQTDVKKRSIWWLVPLMALWVNVHAGFAVGIALILLVIIGMALPALGRRESFAALWRRLRSLCLVLVGCLGAVLLNPNGARINDTRLRLSNLSDDAVIEEWRRQFSRADVSGHWRC